MNTYRNTLSSSRWQVLKWRRMLHAEFKCEGCGRCYHGPRRRAARWFNLHHLHYNTVGRESLEDVALLCRICHRLEHGKL